VTPDTRPPLKVLIVDDTPQNLVALEALLRADDVEVLKAASGAEALELLLVHEVVLALLDVQMPEMDGYELAELMRGAERTKRIPIIFLTAGAHDWQRLFKGYETGAVDFLFKPFDDRILKSKVEVFLELARQRAQLAQALRVNEMFVGIVGHDLRNPLGAMLVGVEFLQELVEDDLQKRTLQRMAAAGGRMTEMIEQLLDLTRARLGGGLGFVRARSRVDLAELVQRAVDELRGPNAQRDLRVESSGDCATSGDPERLVQLFSNLLGNALAHGDPASPITVDVAARDREVVVTVHNRGAIPAEMLPLLFEPFRPHPAQKKTKSPGLGLGMFIARQIATAHGGDVTVESSEETGTLVTVRLPKRAGASTAPLGSPAIFAEQRTVLIVEDEDDLRETLREAFEGRQWRVSTAANGREALDLLLEGHSRPDVVIFDLMMPELDGNGLYKAMQSNPALRSIPVLVSTADPARAPSGLVVLRKPVKLARLLEEVAELGKHIS
jgi:signal transduction histidine kinase